MRLERGPDGAVVLYDDHGRGWTVTLGPEEAAGRPVIRFERPREEPIRAPFEGAARDARDLSLDDVGPHFLDGGD